MAKAPKPRAENEGDTDQALTITIKGRTERLAIGNLSFGERAAVRKATGLPLEAFLPADELESNVFGLDSLQVLWWLACRGSNPMLTLTRVLDEWPAALAEDDISVELVTPDDEDADPEA